MVSCTVSVGSKTVTVRGPAGKLVAMLMTAVKLVGEFTVTEFTVMPPKLTDVLPCTKCVNWPVMATDRFCWPTAPVLGLIWVRTGVPGLTVKPPVRLAVSAPVVSVTLRTPVVAAGSIFTTAVALAGEFTVRDATVIPAPKLAVVVPWTKCVKAPVMATDKPC